MLKLDNETCRATDARAANRRTVGDIRVVDCGGRGATQAVSISAANISYRPPRVAERASLFVLLGGELKPLELHRVTVSPSHYCMLGYSYLR